MTSRKAILSLVVLLLASAPLVLAQGTYTQVDYPGAVQTYVYGIDTAGDVVGAYVDTNNNVHGFLLSSGIFTVLDVPGATGTAATGINDMGQIVGSTNTDSFLYDVATQTFTQFSSSFANSTTTAYAINNAGTIVGVIAVNHTNGPIYGFELKGTKYAQVAFPKRQVTATYLFSINNLGEAIGQAVAGPSRRFLYAKHKFTTLVVPGISNANILGLNDQGAMVGFYVNASLSTLGFVYQNGSVQDELEFPGSNTTYAYSINNSGELAGFFYDSNNVIHGYTWTPPAARH
jgi:uncharacterized membrane protein